MTGYEHPNFWLIIIQILVGLGTIFGSFFSVKIAVARLEVKVEVLEKAVHKLESQ